MHGGGDRNESRHSSPSQRAHDEGLLWQLNGHLRDKLAMSAFVGQTGKHTLILSLAGSYPSGHLEAFTRLPYRPSVTDRAMATWRPI